MSVRYTPQSGQGPLGRICEFAFQKSPPMIFVKTRKQYIRTWSSSVVADHKNADHRRRKPRMTSWPQARELWEGVEEKAEG